MLSKKEKLDNKGEPIGTKNQTSLLDTRLYEVEFINGTTEALTYNIVAEILLSRIYEEGHWKLSLDRIINHIEFNTSIKNSDGYMITSTVIKQWKMTTRIRELCLSWKDSSTDKQ